MHRYIDSMRDLEEKRSGLDIQVDQLLEEIDTAKSFENIDPETQYKDLPEDSKVKQLVAKLIER